MENFIAFWDKLPKSVKIIVGVIVVAIIFNAFM
jgi:hypothetical protein